MIISAPSTSFAVASGRSPRNNAMKRHNGHAVQEAPGTEPHSGHLPLAEPTLAAPKPPAVPPVPDAPMPAMGIPDVSTPGVSSGDASVPAAVSGVAVLADSSVVVGVRSPGGLDAVPLLASSPWDFAVVDGAVPPAADCPVAACPVADCSAADCSAADAPPGVEAVESSPAAATPASVERFIATNRSATTSSSKAASIASGPTTGPCGRSGGGGVTPHPPGSPRSGRPATGLDRPRNRSSTGPVRSSPLRCCTVAGSMAAQCGGGRRPR